MHKGTLESDNQSPINIPYICPSIDNYNKVILKYDNHVTYCIIALYTIH